VVVGLADLLGGPWPVESIPNPDSLYMRVHKNEVTAEGEPKVGVFRNRPNPEEPNRPPAMSTDWSKHSSPLETRNRAHNSLPSENGVISLRVGRVRRIDLQQVDHTPQFREPEAATAPNNRAHTDVAGPKSPKEATSPEERVLVVRVRFEFSEAYSWELRPPRAPQVEEA